MPENTDVKSYAKRIKSLEEERYNTGLDIKSVYEEAEKNGIDIKILKKAIAAAKKNIPAEERERINAYLEAMNELPLFAVRS